MNTATVTFKKDATINPGQTIEITADIIGPVDGRLNFTTANFGVLQSISLDQIAEYSIERD